MSNTNTTALEQRYQALLDETRKLGEEIEKQKKQGELPRIIWKPNEGYNYYALSSLGVQVGHYTGHSCDHDIINRQQVFKANEEAEKADRQRIAKMRVLRRVAELNHEQGWVCDWDNNAQVKKFTCYDHKEKKVATSSSMYTQYLTSDLYAQNGVWEQVIKEMPADVKLGLWGIE